MVTPLQRKYAHQKKAEEYSLRAYDIEREGRNFGLMTPGRKTRIKELRKKAASERAKARRIKA